jgi:hypothetical protein
VTELEKLIGDLKRIANGFHFTATRVGDAGYAARLQAQENEQTIQDAIFALRTASEICAIRIKK